MKQSQIDPKVNTNLNENIPRKANLKNKLEGKLGRLYEINQRETERWNDNLIGLVADEETLYIAYQNLKNNKGFLSKSADEDDDPHEFQKESLEKLSKEIKEGSFEWKPIRKIEVPKLGSTKKRLLGIPNPINKLVQESIRMILNVIYEPTFQKHEINFGFRPNRSAHSAIKKIQEERQGMTTAIKGGIKKAYENVNQKIMMTILKKKIRDSKLLKLIEEGFKLGILFEGEIKINEKRVPQGGILSQLLFNVYMSEFDTAAREITNKTLIEINLSEARIEKPFSSHYIKKVREADKIRKRIRRQKTESIGIYKDLKIFKLLKKELRKVARTLTITNILRRSSRKLFFSYTRYADDWIILTNANEYHCQYIKKKLSEWLNENLNLELSIEKTKITIIEEKIATFLGFTLFSPPLKIIKCKLKGRVIKKRRDVGVKTGIDLERVYSRLKTEGILDKTNRPIHSNKYAVLKTWQIVKIFQEKLLGMYSYYYYSITDKSKMSVIYYILLYSCYKTIAKRERLSIKKVIMKYGRELNVKYQDPYNGKNRTIRLQSYKKINFWAKEKAIERKTMEIEQKIENKKICEPRKSIQLETEKYFHIGPRQEIAIVFSEKTTSDFRFMKRN